LTAGITRTAEIATSHHLPSRNCAAANCGHRYARPDISGDALAIKVASHLKPKEVYDSALARLVEIGAASEGRRVEGKRSGGKGLRPTFVQLAFELPAGSPRDHEVGKVMES
jgi:hypothetical protein